MSWGDQIGSKGTGMTPGRRNGGEEGAAVYVLWLYNADIDIVTSYMV